jgi:propanediol dehydratase large subunit
VQNQTWEIRLRTSTSCPNQVWASLMLAVGSNPNLSNSKDIQVYTQFQYDLLPSTHFGSGAYTNMITYSNNFACAQYDGNGISLPPAACF